MTENIWLEKASEIRNAAVHYNCAQAVVMTFAEPCGLTEERACSLCAFFGAGAKMGELCGAISGGLMVIGLLGGGDSEYRRFVSYMKERHSNLVRCSDLLRQEVGSPAEKKPHCDGMVYEAVEAVAEIMNL